MTKAELLVDLAAQDGVLRLLGDPEDTTPSGETAGVKWYQQNLIEARGKTALKRTVYFYVFDELEPEEEAYYKEELPEDQKHTTASALREWMRAAVDASPDTYKGIQILWLSERWEMVIFAMLDASGDDLAWQAYYIRKGAGAAKKITNHEAQYIASIFSV